MNRNKKDFISEVKEILNNAPVVVKIEHDPQYKVSSRLPKYLHYKGFSDVSLLYVAVSGGGQVEIKPQDQQKAGAYIGAQSLDDLENFLTPALSLHSLVLLDGEYFMDSMQCNHFGAHYKTNAECEAKGEPPKYDNLDEPEYVIHLTRVA